MSTSPEPRIEAPALAATEFVPYAEMRETHSAVVFLLGDRAYKLKKPVDLGFLDFSTREKRLAVCRKEVALNQRLAPEVYLGVCDVTDEDNRPLDHLIAMKRMPADRRLSNLVGQDADLDAEIRDVAHLIAAFHSRCARGTTISASGDRAALAQRWESNIAGVEAFEGFVVDHDQVVEVDRLWKRFLAGRGPLFTDRILRGAVIDGHGDLLAEDIFLLPDGPQVLDCIEFDEHLRYLDQLDDVACLAMDLEHLNAPDLGQLFIDAYLEFSGDNVPTSLVHHYIAYRAFMRAKVTCLRTAQSGTGAAEARQLVELAHRHLDEGRVCLVLVGGPPGSGKSSTAEGIADQLGFSVLSSDRIRKELAGVAAESSQAADYDEGIYTLEWTERTYAEVLCRAELLLAMGESVVLDATWSVGRWREAAARIANATSSDFYQLCCEVDATTADARIVGRTATPSDADPGIAAVVRESFDIWADAVTVDTAQALDACVSSGVEAIRPERIKRIG